MFLSSPTKFEMRVHVYIQWGIKNNNTQFLKGVSILHNCLHHILTTVSLHISKKTCNKTLFERYSCITQKNYIRLTNGILLLYTGLS